MQGLFYASVVIYPIAMVIEKSETAAKILLLNPVAQAIQDIRYVLINQDHTPTLLSLTNNWLIMFIPIGIVLVTFIFGAFYFKKKSPSFAESL
jgi:ABC-2 type transport system permease protein